MSFFFRDKLTLGFDSNRRVGACGRRRALWLWCSGMLPIKTFNAHSQMRLTSVESALRNRAFLCVAFRWYSARKMCFSLSENGDRALRAITTTRLVRDSIRQLLLYSFFAVRKRSGTRRPGKCRCEIGNYRVCFVSDPAADSRTLPK